MSPEKAAALFDVLGVVQWSVVHRATITKLHIRQLELEVAWRLRELYGGNVARRTSVSAVVWSVSGRDSDIFGQVILPHLSEKRELLEFYLRMRSELIDTNGRGRGGTLDDEQLELRRLVAEEISRMQKGVEV